MRKYPDAPGEWRWPWVFPQERRNPGTGEQGRHHQDEMINSLVAAMDASVRAKALARLLALGCAEPCDVVRWGDSLIVETQVPNEFLIDATLSETRRGELITALERFGATARTGDASELWSAILGGLHAWLLEHPDDGPRIAHALCEMAIAGEFPDSDAEGEMYSLDDQYELALNGAHGARSEVDANLRTFLGRYAA